MNTAEITAEIRLVEEHLAYLRERLSASKGKLYFIRRSAATGKITFVGSPGESTSPNTSSLGRKGVRMNGAGWTAFDEMDVNSSAGQVVGIEYHLTRPNVGDSPRET